MKIKYIVVLLLLVFLASACSPERNESIVATRQSIVEDERVDYLITTQTDEFIVTAKECIVVDTTGQSLQIRCTHRVVDESGNVWPFTLYEGIVKSYRVVR